MSSGPTGELETSEAIVRMGQSQRGPLSIVDPLVARVARWPWWAIIIVVGIVVAFYAIATSALYRRTLVFVTGNPQLTTDQIANVAYRVQKADGSTEDISGVMSSETGDSVTVITHAEEQSIVPRSDIAKITCDSPDPDGSCPVNKQVTVTRATMEGALLFETLGQYTIRTLYLIDEKVFRIALVKDKEVRIPADCKPNPDGGCNIKVTFNPDRDESQVTGLLLESTADQLTVQVQPKVTVTIPKSNIVQVINSTPAQCAVNNLAACNEGIFLTLWVTFAAFLGAIVIGLIFGLMRVSSNFVLFNLSTVYVEVIRGVPLLVILLFMYFAFAPWFRDNFPSMASGLTVTIAGVGGVIVAYYAVTRWSRRKTDPVELIQPLALTIIFAAALIFVVSVFKANAKLEALQAAILGLAVGYGAFLAELFRAGIQSIGRGQMEAARSLGMSYVEAMRFVILPQAFRVILPPLGNDFIAMLKDTSLIAILALPELTQKGRLFAALTLNPFPTYLTIGVLYLCMTLFLSFMVRVAERRVSTPK